MSLLWTDSFDSLTTEYIPKKYFGSEASISTSSYYGSGALFNELAGNGIPLYGIPPTDTIIFGGWFRDSVPCNGAFCSCILDMYGEHTNGSQYLQLRLLTPASGEGPGNVMLVQNGAGTTLAQSQQYMRSEVWYFMEVKVHVHSTTGSVELRMNNEEWINVTGVNTKNTADYIDAIQLGGPLSSTCSKAYLLWDGIYILNTSGDFANDFIGPCRCEAIIPTGDVSSTFSGSDGNQVDNFDLITTTNGLTNYIYAANSGDITKHYMSDLNNRAEVIYGLQFNALIDKSHANYIRAQTILNNATGEIRDIYPPHNDMIIRSIQYEKNPNTTQPWTNDEINSIEVGLKIIRN